jgi:hypothetical protein
LSTRYKTGRKKLPGGVGIDGHGSSCGALVINRGFRGVGILGVFLLMPWAVAPVVTGLYWNFIFNGNFGLATGGGDDPGPDRTTDPLAPAVSR